MNHNPPQIVTLAERLMVEIEDAVSRFPRRHKYGLGDKLRAAGEEGALLAQQAWRAQADKARQVSLVQQFIRSNDALKLRLQVGHRLQCFTSGGRFEQLASLASDLGRQAGGWHKQIAKHLNGQNPAAVARPERPETLSTAAASQGAKP